MVFRDIVKADLAEYMEDLDDALEGLTPEERRFQPTPESHHIDFVVWHIARVEDGLINHRIRHSQQVWERDGWHEKLGLPEHDSGFGFSVEQVVNLPHFSLDDLMAYYRTVREEAFQCIDLLTAEDLNTKIVMTADWEVTVGGMLGHLIVEEAQHVGQIAYIRGIQRGIDG